jgi:hypothetical protein
LADAFAGIVPEYGNVFRIGELISVHLEEREVMPLNAASIST